MEEGLYLQPCYPRERKTIGALLFIIIFSLFENWPESPPDLSTDLSRSRWWWISIQLRAHNIMRPPSFLSGRQQFTIMKTEEMSGRSAFFLPRVPYSFSASLSLPSSSLLCSQQSGIFRGQRRRGKREKGKAGESTLRSRPKPISATRSAGEGAFHPKGNSN